MNKFINSGDAFYNINQVSFIEIIDQDGLLRTDVDRQYKRFIVSVSMSCGNIFISMSTEEKNKAIEEANRVIGLIEALDAGDETKVIINDYR